MTGEFSSTWLTLREPADAAARDRDLIKALRLPAGGELVIRDLGCGTGSMGRWLAPLLPGPQRWVLQDRDPALLAHAAANLPAAAADGTAVTVTTAEGDVTDLTVADLADTSLVTCSALLDLFTTDEVAALAEVCVASDTPALFTLSVVGEVTLEPADPLDAEVAEAFNAHQRRAVGDRRLLGPEAVGAAAEAFAKAGVSVTVRPSPWQLGPELGALAAEWLRGWVGAAADQRPDLHLDEYLAARTTAAEAGRLRVTVGHQDLLAQKV
ncbi:SAM-dependent methyltransferase [Actinoplanes sp. ATCC 53533]|uniref:methyltransferase domain-containing protein n=1 Tax=Actinoplanes sp. ATCC 53533 TaxID=1288362 RepID=UPI000F789EBE|nr:methyltransferase domain-containing protein [Actinoplanes sp. ATCC 53533]RSM72507.1 SAM-dependent methyltransferase [Actinoplanes sp. ATCC 53533]